MATINSIGTTARDYSTLQAWADAIPATPTGGYIGECYNDSEFTAGVEITGHTTSGTNFIKLTAATGQSFADHASKATNPLQYDQSKGVGVAASVGGINTGVFYSDNDFVSVTRLQIKNTQSGYDSNAIHINPASGAGNTIATSMIDQCICEGSPNFIGATNRAVVIVGIGKVTNTIVINRFASSGCGMSIGIGVSNTGVYNCTIVTPSDLAKTTSTGIIGSYSGNEVKNCAVFGFAVDSSGGSITITTSYTDLASPRTGFTGSATYTDQFVDTTGSEFNFSLKAGATLIDAGADIHASVSEVATDIIGTSRTVYDVGAWEVAAVGGGRAGKNTRAWGLGTELGMGIWMPNEL